MDDRTETERTLAAEAELERVEREPQPVGAARRKILAKPEGRGPKILRVTMLALVIGLVFAGFSYQRARGQIGESLLGAGAQMMLMSDAERQDAPRQMVLNGQRIQFSTGVAPYSVDALLDRFEASCERIDAGLMEHVSEALAMAPDEGNERLASSGSPVIRDQNGGNGYVACLDLGREDVDMRALLARFQRFERTRDLHTIGDLRYVYAQPIGDGERSHFVALWTEGSLRLGEIFPDDGGDARGEDPADVPRPPGARRVLTAYEAGDPQRATFYQTDELDEGGLASFYRRELVASGWTLLEASDARAQLPADVRPALVAQRAGRMVWLAFTTETSGRVGAAVIETGERALADES